MRYRPSNIAAPDFDVVRQFVVDAVTDYRPRNSQLALTLASTLTRYVSWATTTQNAPLDRDDLFYPTLMQQFLRTQGYTPATIRSMRSRLYRLATTLTEFDYPRNVRKPNNELVQPLTAAELARTDSWATSHPSKSNRLAAATGLALFGGAGLFPREALALRGQDIVATASGRTISVGGKFPREVPIHSDWTWHLDEPSQGFTPERFVLFPGCSQRTRENSLRNLFHGRYSTYSPRRLRDHWVIGQLRVLPVGAALHVAGLGDESPLRRYLPALNLTNTASYEALIRNPNGATR